LPFNEGGSSGDELAHHNMNHSSSPNNSKTIQNTSRRSKHSKKRSQPRDFILDGIRVES